MKWNEFIDKIRAAKARKISLGFTASSVVTMIFSGCFNGMVAGDAEYMSMPAWKRCSRMSTELLTALGSQAEFPKKTKTQAIGIREIDSDTALVLWRHITNPLFRYSLIGLHKEHLKTMFGFTDNTRGNTQAVPLVKEPSDSKPTDLLARFDVAFYGGFAEYSRSAKNAAVLGIISKVSERRYQNNSKTALDVFFFDGFNEYSLTIWPPFGQKAYSPSSAVDLTPGAFGVLLFKPSVYKGNFGGSLNKFYQIKV